MIQAGYFRCALHVDWVQPPVEVEPGLLLADDWEGFAQVNQLEGLAMTTNHQSLPSMEDQLCWIRVVVL